MKSFRRGNFRQYFFYRKEINKTTWSFRFLVLVVLLSGLALTRGFWVPALGGSLVHKGSIEKSDAILIDNQDAQYLLFERTAELQKKGLAARVIIPVEAEGGRPGLIPQGLAEVMSRVGRIRNPEYYSYEQLEPITYNLAAQLSNRLEQEGIRSLILVSVGFRSKRDFMIFDRVLSAKGIKVYCEPVFGRLTPENWIHSWHGVQEVILQLGKLQYYRVRLLFLP
jgi:hypothetical protein